MIVPRTHFPFCHIGVVDKGWGVLEVFVLFASEGFDIVRHLVVHLMKLWFEAPCGEVGIDQLVCPQETGFRWGWI